jgi:DNA-binding response OmpR family regulator
MPKATGMELLIRLREFSHELPVIFLSGIDTSEQRVRA